jgi:release factor glutamine methyltransferase
MADSSSSTVLHILNTGTSFLEKKNIENPRLACELLLSRLVGCPRLELMLRQQDTLTEKRLDAMRRGIKRVAAGEPVQYVIGETGFLENSFKVDSRALIPRPETELLVNLVLDCVSIWLEEVPAIVDVGTGSGCIILSLAAARPQGKYLALDVSDDALSLARENAAAMQLESNVHFVNADLADVVDPESLDAVVANLPYISTSDCEKLPKNVRDHEPRQALDGGPDGLTIIRSVIQDAGIILKNNGMLFLEIGEDQGPAVVELLKESGFSDVTLKQDLAERDRVVFGRLAL